MASRSPDEYGVIDGSCWIPILPKRAVQFWIILLLIFGNALALVDLSFGHQVIFVESIIHWQQKG